MLKEINGFHLTGEKAGQLLTGFTEMKADGSTAGGCWIYSGVYADGVNQVGPAQARAASSPGSRRSGAGPGR